MTDLPDHDPVFGDHGRPISVITMDRSWRSPWAETRTGNAYYGHNDEIEDKEEALRLLHKSKSLNCPGAFVWLAEYHVEEAEDFDTSDYEKRENYQLALETLKDGAQRGHGACYVLMAQMYADGIANRSAETPDPQNALKCWKKYFQSQTFANDDGEEADCIEDGLGNLSFRAMGQSRLRAARLSSVDTQNRPYVDT